MTSRAVLHSLRALRFNRVLLNARRWRFLDSVVFYGGAVNGRQPFLHLMKPPARHCKKQEISINRKRKLSSFHSSHSAIELETEFNLEISSEGLSNNDNNSNKNSEGSDFNGTRLPNLITTLQEDVMKALKYLVILHRKPLKKEIVELSLILCNDRHIHDLNLKYLSVDGPTDVLSFPLDGIEQDDGFPVMILGDIILSLETAEKQARAMGHDLISECRILIVHALLHLLGYDHDQGDQEWAKMAEMEKQTLKTLGWKGQGLIADIQRLMILDNNENKPPMTNTASNWQSTEDRRIHRGRNFAPDRGELSLKTSQQVAQDDFQQSPKLSTTPIVSNDVHLVALDLDGTLLTSHQQISQPTKEAIQETMNRGIQVVIATGKARPGAISACEKFGLSGPGNLVSLESAGIFLQGLVVYTTKGKAIEGPNLPISVVKSMFEYCSRMKISCAAFTGDEVCTLQRTPELIELHERYYEPFPEQVGSLNEILTNQSVKKIAVIGNSDKIRDEIEPEIGKLLTPFHARAVISVEGMLEIVPQGVNKWTALDCLMKSLELPVRSCLAIGDGQNDYEMVKNAGIGVAMGNAVQPVKAVADLVVSSNDEDGIAEALDRLILS
eukprot:g1189.t1